MQKNWIIHSKFILLLISLFILLFIILFFINHILNKKEHMSMQNSYLQKNLKKNGYEIDIDNFIIKKGNGKSLEFSFFKLNAIYYININGHHIIDYKHFINIQHISNESNNVKLQNPFIGDITLVNCDIDIVYKSLTIMAKWMKSKQTIFNNIMYYMLH